MYLFISSSFALLFDLREGSAAGAEAEIPSSCTISSMSLFEILELYIL